MPLLPETFRGKVVSELVTEQISTPLGRIYPNYKRAQRFEYTDRAISGYLIDIGSRIDAMLQHDASFPNAPDAIGVGTSSTFGYLSRLTVDSGTNRPHLYWVMGQYAVYVTFLPLPDSDDGAALLSTQFAGQILTLNPEKALSPPYYVELWPINVEPQFSKVLSPGEVVPVAMTFDYALIDPAEGQIHLELRQHDPDVVTEQTLNVTRGLGSVTFLDTLRIASDIPDTGSVLTISARLSPPYQSDVKYPRGIFFLETKTLPDGTFRHTASKAWSYLIRK